MSLFHPLYVWIRHNTSQTNVNNPVIIVKAMEKMKKKHYDVHQYDT